MANTGLNIRRDSGTLADMGGRRRKVPTTTLNGPSLSTHLKEALDEIARLETDAYAELSGKTKVSFSDQLEEAVELYVRDYIDKHGSFDMLNPKERGEYVKRLAEWRKQEIRATYSRPSPP